MVMRFIFIIAIHMLWTSTALAATLTAGVDRQSITADEHIVFTLSLINSNTRLRAEGLSPNVDLSVLTPDFDVGIPRADNRFNLSRRHDDERGGQAISSITVELFPKRTGHYTLPSFLVDGQRSKPITITVSAAPVTTTPEIFVRSGVNKTTVWAREQTIVYLELLHRVNLDTASLGGDIQTSPARIELLDYRKLPQTERKEQIAGITYNVQRIAWALFPNQGGNLTVRLPDIWAIINKGAEQGRRIRLPGKQHPIQIKALPADVPADMLVGKPIISQSPLTPLPDLAPDINSLTSWNITLRAPVMDHTLPSTLPGLTAPSGIKLYMDNAQRQTEESTNGIISIANYTVSVTPLAAGEFRMPTIRVPYFDPQRGIADAVELSGQTLIVKAGPQPITITPTSSISQVKLAPTESTTSSTWKVTTIIFAMLWAATIILWLRARSASSSANPQEKTIANKTPTIQPEHLALHPLQTLLLDAFGSQSLEQGLNEWEVNHGIDQELRETVRAIQRLYYGKEKIDDVHLQTTVRTAITKIHAARQQPSTPKNTWLAESFTHRV